MNGANLHLDTRQNLPQEKLQKNMLCEQPLRPLRGQKGKMVYTVEAGL